MESNHTQYSLKKIKLFTRKIVYVDIVINFFVGISLTLAPSFVGSLLFNKNPLPIFLYLILGIGLTLFAVWQTLFLIKPNGFTVGNLRFAALLAWIPSLGLTIGLFSQTGNQLMTNSKIILWIGNIYMLLLGELYWWLAKKPPIKKDI